MPRKKRTLDKGKVIQAAIAVVNLEGPEACGVNRVARSLGIKPPSLYNHVKGNDALRIEVVLEGVRGLQRATTAAAGPGDSLERISNALRAWVRDNPGLYRLMSTTPLDPADPMFQVVLASMLAPYVDAMAERGFAGDDAIHAIRALRAAVHGFILLELDGQFQMNVDPDESWRRMLTSVLRGL